MRHAAVLACLSITLGGCMIGPDFLRPKVETPAAFRYEEKTARDLVNTQWWKQLGDPVLEALIGEALANNLNVQIAATNVQAAAAVLTQTQSALYPQIGYQGNAAQQRFSERNAVPLNLGIPNPHNAYAALLDASWEIDLWGRIRRLSESARASALATEEARRGVILSLVASVASSYIQLRSFDTQLDIAQRTLLTYAGSVKLFELQFKYGQISLMTVEQARSQYETAAAAIPQIQREIALTENALSILCGRNPGPVARGKALAALLVPDIPSGVPSQLLERRPDIAQAEQQLVAANAQIGAAKAQYFPAISLTGSSGSSSSQLSGLFSGGPRAWSFAGAVAGPIFTGGLISGQVAQAEAGQQAALLNYRLVIQTAFADVENALVTNQATTEQVAAEGRRVRALREYVRLATLQYNGGYADYLTVLNAQQQLFPAEINYAQNLGRVYTSLVGIYKAMGGGWIGEADKLTSQQQLPANLR